MWQANALHPVPVINIYWGVLFKTFTKRLDKYAENSTKKVDLGNMGCFLTSWKRIVEDSGQLETLDSFV